MLGVAPGSGVNAGTSAACGRAFARAWPSSPSLASSAASFPPAGQPVAYAHGNVITVVDGADEVGNYTSLVLDEDGRPVVSYHDETHGDLKLVHCGDENCASGNVIVTVDDGVTATGFEADAGAYTSLALDPGGNPVVSYYWALPGHVRVAFCGDENCSNVNNIAAIRDCPPALGGRGQERPPLCKLLACR